MRSELAHAAASIQDYLRSRGLPFCVIGGIAVQHWGEQRLTIDVDVSIFAGFGNEEALATDFFKAIRPRVENAIQFALDHRVMLGQVDGLGIDAALSGFPFEERIIARAVDVEYEPGVVLRICSAEDLIVLKAFAGRPQDWRDVEGIVIRQGSKLDWTIIETELAPLLETSEDTETMDRLLALQQAL